MGDPAAKQKNLGRSGAAFSDSSLLTWESCQLTSSGSHLQGLRLPLAWWPWWDFFFGISTSDRVWFVLQRAMLQRLREMGRKANWLCKDIGFIFRYFHEILKDVGIGRECWVCLHDKKLKRRLLTTTLAFLQDSLMRTSWSCHDTRRDFWGLGETLGARTAT